MSVLSTQLKTTWPVLGKWKSPAHFSASALPVAASGLPVLHDAVSVGKERPAGGFLRTQSFLISYICRGRLASGQIFLKVMSWKAEISPQEGRGQGLGTRLHLASDGQCLSLSKPVSVVPGCHTGGEAGGGEGWGRNAGFIFIEIGAVLKATNPSWQEADLHSSRGGNESHTAVLSPEE